MSFLVGGGAGASLLLFACMLVVDGLRAGLEQRMIQMKHRANRSGHIGPCTRRHVHKNREELLGKQLVALVHKRRTRTHHKQHLLRALVRHVHACDVWQVALQQRDALIRHGPNANPV